MMKIAYATKSAISAHSAALTIMPLRRMPLGRIALAGASMALVG